MPEGKTIEDLELTPGRTMRVMAVYEFIARLLPTEGRDYSVEFTFGEDDPSRFSVKFVPHTEIGKTWCDICTRELSRRGGSK